MLWTDDFNFLQLITIECFRTSSNNREPVKMITETELSQRITEIVFLVKNYRNSYMPVKNISCNQEMNRYSFICQSAEDTVDTNLLPHLQSKFL